MNILYVHGYGSKYDPYGEKIATLSKIGRVFGVDVNYDDGLQKVEDKILEATKEFYIDMIIGTSMGGYMARRIGSELGIPFVAMNPVVDAKARMLEKITNGISYTDIPSNMTEAAALSYTNTRNDTLTGYGLILLDNEDEVLDHNEADFVFEDFYEIIVFNGGNHRFAHTEAALGNIKELGLYAYMNYGLSQD